MAVPGLVTTASVSGTSSDGGFSMTPLMPSLSHVDIAERQSTGVAGPTKVGEGADSAVSMVGSERTLSGALSSD